MTQPKRFLVTEVHNFGGFFGGDTVTLDAAPYGSDDARTIVIDARALANVPDRHMISAGMVFDLEMDGERVDRAVLLGAEEVEQLREALGAPALPAALDAPLVVSKKCGACGRWSPSELWSEAECGLCGGGSVA